MDTLKRNASFLVSEANGYRSRDKATVASGENLESGAVVKTSSGKKVAYDGSGTADGIMLHAVDATGGDVEATVIARDAEVIDAELTNKNSGYDTDLKNAGFVLR